MLRRRRAGRAENGWFREVAYPPTLILPPPLPSTCEVEDCRPLPTALFPGNHPELVAIRPLFPGCLGETHQSGSRWIGKKRGPNKMETGGLKARSLSPFCQGLIGWGARRNIDSALDVLSMVMSSWRPRMPPLFPGGRTRPSPVLSAAWRTSIRPRYRPLGDGVRRQTRDRRGCSLRMNPGAIRPRNLYGHPAHAVALTPLDRAGFPAHPAGPHDVSRRISLLVFGEPTRPTAR